MEAVRLLALTIVAALLYGFAHDQVTAQVCAEYFTLGHPPVHSAGSATLVLTGMTAAWYFGLVLGFPLALLATAGDRTPLGAGALVPAIGAVLVKVAVVSAVAGGAAYVLVEQGSAAVPAAVAAKLAPDRHAAFLAAYWAHRAACVTGVIGAALVCAWTWHRRGRLSGMSTHMAR